jgi:hypothetical protein
MTIPSPVRPAPARVPNDADADAAALTLVLSHAEVAALRRQLAALIAPEPYGEGDDIHAAADDLRHGLQARIPKAAPGGAARKL